MRNRYKIEVTTKGGTLYLMHPQVADARRVLDIVKAYIGKGYELAVRPHKNWKCDYQALSHPNHNKTMFIRSSDLRRAYKYRQIHWLNKLLKQTNNKESL